jgi:hypothetical protein
MITRIFLGSSAERIPILEELEGYLSTVGKCQRWTGAFVPNASGLESLIHQTRLSDFSVLLAMKDDITIKRGEEFNVARDNMIFEFGLFLGAAGIRKAFLLAEEGIDLPSDLDGITLHRFTTESGKYNSLDKVADQIKESIAKSLTGSELGLLPSTALALGYYNQFIKKVSDELHGSKTFYCGDQAKPLGKFQIHVLVPLSIDHQGVDDMIDHYIRVNRLTPASTQTKEKRGYPFHFSTADVEPGDGGFCHIYDLPTTLNTVLKCIDLLAPAEQLGPDPDRSFMEQRELDNFCKVLNHLVEGSISTRGHVLIERI